MKFFLRLSFLLTVFGYGCGFAAAQSGKVPDLNGKTLAVYISKKTFFFDEDYRFLLASYIKSDQGKEMPLDDIKQQSLISLGTSLPPALASALGADSMYFLSEKPELAREFIYHYDIDSLSLAPLGETFAGTDYILVINPLRLGSRTRKIVTVYSDQVRTLGEMVKTAHLRLDLFDPRTGTRVLYREVCYDEFDDPVPPLIADMGHSQSEMTLFFSRLFSLSASLLREGTSGNCR